MKKKEKNDEKIQFFEENDKRVNGIISKILLWVTFAFPCLFILSILGIFHISIKELCIMTPIGCICTIGPTVLKRMNISTEVLKYLSLSALAIVVALMASNANVGIYITYALAMVMSCLYFEPKFTSNIAVLGYVFMLIGLFFRSQNVVLSEGGTSLSWFRAYSMGFTIEYVIFSAVCIKLVKEARKLLESQQNSAIIKTILGNCEIASDNLAGNIDLLNDSLAASKKGNEEISQFAVRTLQDCNNNLNYVNNTVSSVYELTKHIDMISDKSEEMKKVADDTFESTKAYINVMDGAVSSIENINKTTQATGKVIQELEKRTEEISELTEIVTGIADQTNLLALNASIEAARAGEEGKGFAVVANEVGKLAEESQEAVEKITQHIFEIKESVLKAEKTIIESRESVETGIEYIENAKKEAVKLKDIQHTSVNVANEISDSCVESKEYATKVSSMSEDMTKLMEHSTDMIQEIKNSLNIQENLISNMNTAFNEVDKVSSDLRKTIEYGHDQN